MQAEKQAIVGDNENTHPAPDLHLSNDALAALLEGRYIASLGTLDRDGRIHIVPLWYRREGDRILLPTSSRSHKAQNIRRHSYVSVMIHQTGAGSERGALIRGPVDVVEGPEALELNHSIYLRYVTPKGLNHPAVAESLAGDDVTLRVKMEEVVSWDLSRLESARILREPGIAYDIE